MEITSFFLTIFITCILISVTIYSIFTGFGSASKNLRDPFEEHED
nr:photosystem II protein N [Flexiglena variabilis]WCH63497.1 photosystem II protein N [Flexiglena variabilis]